MLIDVAREHTDNVGIVDASLRPRVVLHEPQRGLGRQALCDRNGQPSQELSALRLIELHEPIPHLSGARKDASAQNDATFTA